VPPVKICAADKGQACADEGIFTGGKNNPVALLQLGKASAKEHAWHSGAFIYSTPLYISASCQKTLVGLSSKLNEKHRISKNANFSHSHVFSRRFSAFFVGKCIAAAQFAKSHYEYSLIRIIQLVWFIVIGNFRLIRCIYNSGI
jgi:hypothetical protein